MNILQLNKLLHKGKIAVIPTDTVYGIVGLALNPRTVEEIYKLRKRTKDKPMIILISGISDLAKFEIKISRETLRILKKLWPNPVSIILPCFSEKFTYLHRGKKSLAFRMPKDKWITDLLKKTGPLVAPSANIEDQDPAETIETAKKYFGDKVFYVNHGKIIAAPSTLIEIEKEKINVLRQGSFAV